MDSEFEFQSLEALSQPVDYQVQSFLHKVSKHRLWPRKHNGSSVRKNNSISDSGIPLEHAEDVKFQKQLDKVALWFEKWSHMQRCFVLEHLILIGNYSQFQLLWTAIQPILHKDFMYTGEYPTSTCAKWRRVTFAYAARHSVQQGGQLEQERFPKENLPPLSTESSRAARDRLTRNRLINKYHRVQSVYIRNEKDVENCKYVMRTDRRQLPELLSSSSDTYLRLPSLHRRLSIMNPTDHLEPSQDDPTANWRRAMQVRRHLQTDVTEEDRHSSFPPHSDALFRWYSVWEGSKRASFLQLALMKLDARQLYFLSSFLSIRRHKDILANLPRPIAHVVLSYLSPIDLSNCSKVSSTWRSLCQHNMVWKRKCEETKLDLRPISTPRVGGWKSAYRKDRMLKLNWKRGNYVKNELLGHTESVLCVAMSEKMIVSGGKDCAVRVWNLASGRLRHLFTGHQKGVWAVAVVSDHLVASGSFDRTVKIWGLGPAKLGCLRTFFGHYGPVWTMICKNKYLASGSQDRMIKVWDVRHSTLFQTLKGHTSTVFSIDADPRMEKLFSGSADKSIRVWDVTSGSCDRVIWTAEPTSIMAVSFSHGLLACTSGGNVTVWDPEKGTRVRCFKAHKQRIEAVKLRMDDETATSGVVMTGGKDGRLKYWNVFGDSEVNKLDEHTGQINALCADPLRIVTASYDKSIIVWDFREKRSSSRTSMHSRKIE